MIAAYRAHLNPASVGLGFQTLVFVTMREGGAETLALFEDSLTALPEVTDAHRLFSDPDYLVRVATQDLASFQRLYDTCLGLASFAGDV